MNKLELENPKRQSPVGIAVIFFRNLRIAVNILVTVIFVQFGTSFSILGLSIYEIAAILAAFFLLISYLQYRRFFFFVKDDKFIIEKGLVSRDKITIPFDRIQTVNIRQNIIQQLLGVVALKIDTAGSKGKEMEIAALEKSYARELQKFLIEKKEREAEIENDEASATEEKERPFEVSSEGKKPLIHLGIAQLFKVGLTENHLRSGIFLFAVINGYIWQYEDYLLKPFEPFLKEQANNILAQGLILVPIGIILFILVSVIFSMIQTLLRYYDLKFYVNEKGVQLKSGLLRRNEFQVPVNKIQQIKWKSNPLRALLKLRTIVIKQASSEETTDRQSVTIPGSTPRQLITVLQEFFSERSKKALAVIKANSFMLLRLFIWIALLPSLILGTTYFLQLPYYWLATGYLPLSFFFIYRYYKSFRLLLMPEVLELKKGWFYPSVTYVQFYKLQNVKLRQSLFQKRRKLMSITFHTAGGDISMPHISEEEAKAIYNYSLYKIESSAKSWM